MIFTEPLARAATGPSTSRERFVALAVALGLIGWTTALSLSGTIPLPPSSPLFAAYAASFVMSALFAALLLVFRARLIGDRSAALIASSFVFCVPLIAGYALTVSAIAGASFARPDAAGWMSFGWRIGWPVAVTWYALRPPSSRGRLAPSVATALGWSVAVIGLALSGLLPHLYVPATGTFRPVLYAANDLTFVVTIVALLSLLRQRSLTTLDTWIAVALVALGTGSALTLFAHGLFSAASDAVRVSYAASSFVLVCALVYEFQKLVRRSASIDRYFSMAQFAASIVYLLDASGACIYVNRRWTDLTGQSAQEALGAGWRAVIHPDDLAMSGETWDAGLVAQRQHDVELRYRCADGTYRWHLATATPTLDADGTLDGWYGSAMDIDAQHRHADELKERYAREHAMAQTLQSAFIPAFLPHVDGLAFRAVYRPALREAELGGDWYDAFVLPDGRIALSIGDVAGHGIDAAIAMVRLRETLRAVTGLNDIDPGSLLQMADRAFMATHPGVIATAAFAMYDPPTRRFVYARAGHPPALLVRNGVATALDSHPGVPLGVLADSTFFATTLLLEPGDVVVLYTDGLVEANRDMLEGERRFIDLLERFTGDAERVVDEALAGGQRDDVAMLQLVVLEAQELTSWHFESDDAASAGDARFAFLAHLLRRKVPIEIATTAELIFGELVSNVVRHAPGPIEIELVARDERLFLIVRDRGPDFATTGITLPDDPLSEGGRGLYLMSSLGSPPIVLPRPGGGNEVIVGLAGSFEATLSRVAVAAAVEPPPGR